MLTRDDFDSDVYGDLSGRKQALWANFIRTTFDEDGGGEVTIHEMIAKLSEITMERPGDFTMHNSQAQMGDLVTHMNRAFNAQFQQVVSELDATIGAAVA